MADAYLYHYFISYSADGRPWVHGILLPKLRRAGKHYLLEEDFVIGAFWLSEMQNAVQKSQQILVVLTPPYLLSKEKKFIEIMAMTKGAKEATWSLIPILLKPVERELILRSVSIVDLTQARTQEQQLNKLFNAQGLNTVISLAKPAVPYPGMRAFSDQEAKHFFGRETEIQYYLDFLTETRCLVIIGASGCGKSLLVNAGLMPVLQHSQLFGQGNWRVIKLRPSTVEFQQWQAAYVEGAQTPAVKSLLSQTTATERVLLVIDQFEELFTLDHETVGKTTLNQQAQNFLQHLAQLFKQSHFYLMITVRDDYFPQLAWCQTWLPLDRYLKRLGALTPDGLIERLLNDIGNDPGILPFVQETLRKLCELMPECFISLHEYETLGSSALSGLKYAIALKAKTAFASLATDTHKAIAQRIFLRLI